MNENLLRGNIKSKGGLLLKARVIRHHEENGGV